MIVADEIVVEHGLHFIDRFKPGLTPFDPEVFVQKRAVEALDDAVRLRPPHLGCAMLDILQLEE